MRGPSLVLAALTAAACMGSNAAALDVSRPVARALLIGVGDYPKLPAALRLAGPPHDVERLRNALVNAGLPSPAIEVMSERQGVRPTRAAVLAALARLARQAQLGQQVLVYFSGHGAQAPARHPEREPDGLEELYLAADAARWDGAAHALPGSIADFELEAALQAIRDRGANVWFVADACHAAGLTRGAQGAAVPGRSVLSEGTRAKTVSAAELGIPAAVSSRGRQFQREAAPVAGDFVGFYAASPGALATERLMPPGASDAEPASVFTFALVRALNQGRFRTFRDLALSIAASGGESGADAAAPVFEGPLGDQVLGVTPAARTFRVRRAGGDLLATAGAPEGFQAGAAVDLLRLTDGGPAGRARVRRSGLSGSELSPIGEVADGPLLARLAQRSSTAEGDSRGQAFLAAVAPLAGLGATNRIAAQARLWRGGCGPNPPAARGFPADTQAIDLLAAPSLRHCDVLYLALANESDAAVDVSPLYVDAAGAIVGLSWAPEDDVRIDPGQTHFAAVRVLTRSPAGKPLAQGLERLVIVAAPAGERRLDLRTLAGGEASRAGPAGLDEGVGTLVFPLRVGG